MRFAHRRDAGAQLACRLGFLRAAHPVVVAVSPGGAAVAFEIAQRLDAPLDIVGVHALEAPLQPGIVIGVVGEHGVRVLNRGLVKRLSVASSWLDTETTRASRAMRDEVGRLRNGLASQPVRSRTVVLVDDGSTVGLTVTAAVEVLRRSGAARIVFATPVVVASVLRSLRGHVAEVVYQEQVAGHVAVGRWFRDFHPVSHTKVRRLLAVAAGLQPDLACEIAVRGDGGVLMGNLAVPVGAHGLVIFPHGRLGGRRSRHSRMIATHLGRAGFGTLLVDLLTPWESAQHHASLDVRLLADRLFAVTRWAVAQPELSHLPVGYFATGATAAAALMAAAEVNLVGAVVSCGGRPDLAAGWLPQVNTPTLLIVGTRDTALRSENLRAGKALPAAAELATVPGTSQRFDQPTTLDEVTDLATMWFVHHLPPPAAAAG